MLSDGFSINKKRVTKLPIWHFVETNPQLEVINKGIDRASDRNIGKEICARTLVYNQKDEDDFSDGYEEHNDNRPHGEEMIDERNKVEERVNQQAEVELLDTSL